jgi:hypothetical protein
MAARFESLCNRNFHDSNRVAVWFGFRSGEIDRRRLDDIDARFGFVRLFTADSETEDRYRGEGVLTQGTGQALDTARRCDADVVFVHAKSAEEKFLAEGYDVKRYPVMYNDFILVGPKDDPAGVKGKDILTALQTIKRRQRPSSRVATAPARTSPRSIFGKRRVSTS